MNLLPLRVTGSHLGPSEKPCGMYIEFSNQMWEKPIFALSPLVKAYPMQFSCTSGYGHTLEWLTVFTGITHAGERKLRAESK